MHYPGKIRRIIIGQNVKDGMSFSIGQILNLPGSTITITDIVHDVEYYDVFKISKYVVYCKRYDSEEHIPFKSTENMPVFLEYDIN